MGANAKKVFVAWSGGKDSAWMLWQLLQDPTIELQGLLTTFNEKYNRVAMHGVKQELMLMQADSLNLPLRQVPLPDPCDNQTYEKIMHSEMERFLREGITHVAFGDLFLEDIRAYRVKNLENFAIDPLFPIWKTDTKILSKKIILSGFKAKIVCIDSDKVPGSFLGRDYDEAFLNDLPNHVDPCGENGEFHTFVYDAPIYQQAIELTLGRKHHDQQFIFVDLHRVQASGLF